MLQEKDTVGHIVLGAHLVQHTVTIMKHLPAIYHLRLAL